MSHYQRLEWVAIPIIVDLESTWRFTTTGGIMTMIMTMVGARTIRGMRTGMTGIIDPWRKGNAFVPEKRNGFDPNAQPRGLGVFFVLQEDVSGERVQFERNQNGN